MFKLYAILAIVALLTTVGYNGFSYLADLQERVGTLQANNDKLEGAVRTQQETIKRATEDAQRQAQLNRELSTKLQEAEQGLDHLRKRFTQIDINKEAMEDPSGLELRINNAVTRLISDIANQTTPQTEPVVSEPATTEQLFNVSKA